MKLNRCSEKLPTPWMAKTIVLATASSPPLGESTWERGYVDESGRWCMDAGNEMIAEPCVVTHWVEDETMPEPGEILAEIDRQRAKARAS